MAFGAARQCLSALETETGQLVDRLRPDPRQASAAKGTFNPAGEIELFLLPENEPVRNQQPELFRFIASNEQEIGGAERIDAMVRTDETMACRVAYPGRIAIF